MSSTPRSKSSPSSVAPRTPRVLLAAKLTALDAPGGGEVQMLALARALGSAGVDARPWRPWEERFDEADALHLFGSMPEHLPLVAAAKRRGVHVVLSPIAWFDVAAYWAEPRSVGRRLLGCAGLVARRAVPQLPSWRRRLYHAVDLLMPNSNAEAEQLMRLFGVSAAKIHVVPNGADERFATVTAEPFAERVGCEGFVLYAGRIEPRKNQLGFLRAMRGAQTPIVILGDAVPGCEDYAAACRREAGENVRFVGRLNHDDPLLGSAYAACGCLVLASWFETPGLVALEAGMSGVPLVLPARGCAPEYFGDLAVYIQPRDRQAIRAAVQGALARGRNPALARHVRRNFSWSAAARVTDEGYQKVLR